MSLQICAPASVIRNEKHEKPNNSNNTCPYKTAKVRHLPQQIQSLSAQPPLPNVKHALADCSAPSSVMKGRLSRLSQRCQYQTPSSPGRSPFSQPRSSVACLML